MIVRSLFFIANVQGIFCARLTLTLERLLLGALCVTRGHVEKVEQKGIGGVWPAAVAVAVVGCVVTSLFVVGEGAVSGAGAVSETRSGHFFLFFVLGLGASPLDFLVGNGLAAARGRMGVVGRPARTLFGVLHFAPFGTPILKPHLHSGLAQVELHGERLAHKHVRIVAVQKGLLQLVQLPAGKIGAAAASLLLVVLVLIALLRSILVEHIR
ncbi:hypothetical protein BpHYR1_026515 [Brachionus plicatilis]|uniref:Uncharacterized protein n=1 Tax=Brachionus plicatilis TaxID=10195 RepID=A0A3M7QUE4_BRAPC|nr:hypothetical protein BpHYR1_026515 [Brachionus plicatilis]